MADALSQRVAETFHALVDLAPHERAQALERLPPPVRERVQRLLDADADVADPVRSAITGVQLATVVGSGQRIGAWKLLRELGAGGMGTVFLAERDDGQFAQRAAIKLIRGFPTADGLNRLRVERQILAALDHPGIARLLDGGEAPGGQPYVVMEYVEGRELLAATAAMDLDLGERLDLFDRIADAVSHAHQHLVIHRDLKPANVMVRPDGLPKLLDFGVAKLIGLGAVDEPRNTSTRIWTPGYASPEQRRGAAVTTAADVYSLGVMLDEMLTGPRESPDGPRRTAPDGFRALVPDDELRGAIAMATAEHPADRYPSVDAMREDLRRWRERRPMRAAPDDTLYRLRKFASRHRVPVAIGAAALALLLGFIVLLGVQRDRALAAEARAEAAADAARSSLDFFAGLVGEVAASGDAGRPITLAQLLERATQRMQRELPAMTPRRAVLQGYIGLLHASAGAAGAGTAMLAPALAALRDQGLDDGAAYASMASDMAIARMWTGDLQAASESARDSARAWRRVAANDPTAGGASLEAAAKDGYAAYLAGDYAAAEAQYRALFGPAPGAATPAAFEEIRDRSAEVYVATLRKLGRFDDALAVAEARIASLAARGLAQGVATQQLLSEKSLVLDAMGRAGDALQALDQAIAAYEAIHGPRGAMYAKLQGHLGAALNSLGRLRESRAAFERALEAGSAASGGPPDDTVLANLGVVCDSEGDYACAIDTFRQIIATQRSLPDDETRLLRVNLARALSLAGRHAEARPMLDALRQEISRNSGPDSPDHAAVLVHSARAALLAGDFDAQRRHNEAARRTYSTLVPETHYIFSVLDRLDGFALLAQRRHAEAEQILLRYVAATQASEPPGSLWTAIAGLDLARLRHVQGRDDEARELLRENLGQVEATLRPTHVDLAPALRLARELGVRGPG